MRKFFAHALVEGQDPFLEYLLDTLNLAPVQHQPVAALTDVDRQKLTSAELALGTHSVLLYDQPLHGSDPAATFDLVDTLRSITRIQQSSTLMSLNRLSQEAFDLFDKVLLVANGRALYQGPRQDAIPYFASLGYMKPSHVESGEFLEDILAGHGAQYLPPGSATMSLNELAECYRSSDHYRDVVRIIQGEDRSRTYWIESEPGIGLSLNTPSKFDSIVSPDRRKDVELVVTKLSSKVGHSGGIESTGRVQVGDVVTGISIGNKELEYLAVGPKEGQEKRADQLYSTLKRAQGHIRLQVERCEDEVPELCVLQACVLGIFAGTLFDKLGGQYMQQRMNSVRALGFVSTMSIMMINLVQLPLYMLQRPIFYKHKGQRFFRTSCYAVAHCIVNLPQTFLEAFVYSVCVYFLAGLSLVNDGRVFFEYLALMFLVAYFGSSVFFFISAISPIPEVANALAGLLVSIFLLFSGFVIYPSNIPQYWKWLMYINPIRWANISFSNLQFAYGYPKPCTDYVDLLPFCQQYPNMTVGKAYVAFFQLSGEAVSSKSWLPYVVIIGWTVIANLLALLSLKKIEFPETSQSLPQQKGRPANSHFLEDSESSSNSLDDFIHENKGSVASASSFQEGEENDGLGYWTDEFQTDMEWEKICIPDCRLLFSLEI